jgi:dTDP-4-dehydrorhamnose 3,5-epimerase
VNREPPAVHPEPIDGVRCQRLHPIPDERGRLMELYSSRSELFVGFAHSYLTTAYPGVVKAWHLHRQQVDNMVCILGMVKLALYDGRDGSPTRGRVQEIFMGQHAPMLVQIPCGVFHGFKCIGPGEAVVINFPSQAYRHDDPDEVRIPPDSPTIPYDWARRDR